MRRCSVSGIATKGRRVSRACDWCGQPYLAIANDLKRGKGFVCSRPCAAARSGGRKSPVDQSGSNNPNWKGGISLGSHARYTKPFKQANPEKVAAHDAVREAVRAGRLTRPAACSACDTPCKPQAHHDDYSKPLEVRWLCVGCHVRLHHQGRRKAA